MPQASMCKTKSYAWITAACFGSLLVAGCFNRQPTKTLAGVEEKAAKEIPLEPSEGKLPEASAEPVTPVAADPPPADEKSSDEKPAPTEPWTTQRIIALVASGPIVVDLSVNVDGKSPDEASKAATNRTMERIGKDLEKPWTWEKILDHPLVKSGWLGNLVPDGQQRSQLISMYNTDGDEDVDDEEFAAFVTRGLARGSALRFTDVGKAPGGSDNLSPWGQLDENRDNKLDKSELAKVQKIVQSFDLNVDGIVTQQEVLPNDSTTPSSMTGMGADMLNYKSAIAEKPDSQPSKVASKLKDHYAAFGWLPREQWSNWSDAQWAELDTDKNQQLSSGELERITSIAPHLQLKVRFESGKSAALPALEAKPDAASDLVWTSKINTAGQASGKACVLAVETKDSYAEASRTNLRQLLTNALSNPQFATVFRTQLQLSEGAFDVLDADNNDQLSDEEFENAWEWLTAIRGSRILARWMIAESAWFRLADTDADGRLTGIELQKFVSTLGTLDKDGDGELTPNEIPMAIRLEVARTDNRLNQNQPQQVNPVAGDAGWFAASDSNSDGYINKSEFLGSEEDFKSYDTDNDGFISRSESYISPAGRLH